MIIPPDELMSSLGGGVFLMDLLRPATPPGPPTTRDTLQGFTQGESRSAAAARQQHRQGSGFKSPRGHRPDIIINDSTNQL